jgi:hypothetical protein
MITAVTKDIVHHAEHAIPQIRCPSILMWKTHLPFAGIDQNQIGRTPDEGATGMVLRSSDLLKNSCKRSTASVRGGKAADVHPG